MLTQVQIHFVRNIINHRLLFGEPDEVIKLDRYRRLAVFQPESIFGYIRWKANHYGTIDWRLYVVKSGGVSHMTQVSGISPAVKVLVFVSGRERMKRALPIMDLIKANTKNGYAGVPESYWPVVQTCVMRNLPLRELPRHYRTDEVCYVG